MLLKSHQSSYKPGNMETGKTMQIHCIGTIGKKIDLSSGKLRYSTMQFP